MDSDELMRKKWPDIESAQAAFRATAIEHMTKSGKRLFPRDVKLAVQLDFHTPDADNQPHIPGVVKAYLDALEGVAYEEDRQVSCLTVHRRSDDHPMMSGASRDGGRRDAFIYAGVEPLARYTELYDIAYRSMWTDRRHSPFLPEWSMRDEVELINQRRALSTMAPERARGGLEELVRSLEEKKLRSGFLADIDRPGPLPDIVNAIHRVLPLPRLHSFLRRRQGAAMFLPLPGKGKGSSGAWKASVDQTLDQFRKTRSGVPFTGWVSLDVAVRGATADGRISTTSCMASWCRSRRSSALVAARSSATAHMKRWAIPKGCKCACSTTEDC